MLEFAHLAVKHVPEVVLSIVDIMPEEDKKKCAEIAKEIGARLRIRELIK